MVSPGMRARVAASGDIFWRLPERALDEAGMLEHCCSVVRRCTSGRTFYIGITEQPPLRWESHAGAGYVVMYVIACAVSSTVTAGLERSLIDRFRVCGWRLANLSSGGDRASAASPHFVYVVVRGDALTRRAGGGAGRCNGSSVAETLFGPL